LLWVQRIEKAAATPAVALAMIAASTVAAIVVAAQIVGSIAVQTVAVIAGVPGGVRAGIVQDGRLVLLDPAGLALVETAQVVRGFRRKNGMLSAQSNSLGRAMRVTRRVVLGFRRPNGIVSAQSKAEVALRAVTVTGVVGLTVGTAGIVVGLIVVVLLLIVGLVTVVIAGLLVVLRRVARQRAGIVRIVRGFRRKNGIVSALSVSVVAAIARRVRPVTAGLTVGTVETVEIVVGLIVVVLLLTVVAHPVIA
jgi:hypothetical protein